MTAMMIPTQRIAAHASPVVSITIPGQHLGRRGERRIHLQWNADTFTRRICRPLP
jgi:hypothetical protein